MNDHTILPTFEEIMTVPWISAATGADPPTCTTIADVFFKRAREEESRGEKVVARVYQFLAQIAFMRLDGNNKETPLAPMIVMETGRSSAPDDYSDAALQIIELLVTVTKIPTLCARFCDLLWIRRNSHRFAHTASINYLEAFKLIDSQAKWSSDTDSVERGLALARVLGKQKPLFQEYIAFIVARLIELEANCTDAYAARLISILVDHRSGDSKRLASIAETIGTRLDNINSSLLAQNYYDIAVRCFNLLNDLPEAQRIKRAKGESVVRMAIGCMGKTGEGCLAATHHLAIGIECLRQGRADEARIQTLHKMLLEWQDKSASEMKSFSYEIDTSKLVDLARKSVSGKPLQNAIFAMAVGHPSLNYKAIRQRVLETLNQFPLRSMFATTVMTSDGRVIANKPSPMTTDADNKNAALEAEMFYQVSLVDWGLRAQSYIDVCRREIYIEHHPTLNNLAFLVQQNPFVPKGHEVLFLKGIVAGFRGELDVTAHLLVPQIEESLRHVLKSTGHITSKLDAELIQEQRLLGTLLTMPETTLLFGEDHVFELRGLLCERFGKDLRNRLAHGFMTYDDCWGHDVLNLWWLVIRLLCIPIVHQQKLDASTSNRSEKAI